MSEPLKFDSKSSFSGDSCKLILVDGNIHFNFSSRDFNAKCAVILFENYETMYFWHFKLIFVQIMGKKIEALQTGLAILI